MYVWGSVEPRSNELVLLNPAFMPNPDSHTTAHYRLSDELARLCLRQEGNDFCRMLAWTNSVCLLFLAVGMVGIKEPELVIRPVSLPAEDVPLIVLQDQDRPEPEEVKSEDSPSAENPAEIPAETLRV